MVFIVLSNYKAFLFSGSVSMLMVNGTDIYYINCIPHHEMIRADVFSMKHTSDKRQSDGIHGVTL